MIRPKDEIIVDFIYPPIPIRTFDWQATWDGDEPDDNGHMLVGYGLTPLDAIWDLLEWTELHEEVKADRRAQNA